MESPRPPTDSSQGQQRLKAIVMATCYDGARAAKIFVAAKPSFLGLAEVQKDGRGSPEQRWVEERRLVDLDGRGGGRFGSVCRTQFVTPAQIPSQAPSYGQCDLPL